jgi:putative thioredoxin
MAPGIPARAQEVTMTLQDSGAAAAPDALITEVTTQSFVADVIEASRRQPVLVDFWAPWCGPCKQLTPVLEKVIRAAKGKARLAKMNIDEHPAVFQQLAPQMGIQSIPAVVAFVGGQAIDGFLGALPESQVTAFLERLIKDRVGGEEQDLLKAADEALAQGDSAGAAEIYAQLLAEDAGNIQALAGLARCYVDTGAVEQARQTLALVPENKQNDAAVAAARAALEIAEQATALGPVTELEQKVAADPRDHQARFDLALALNAKGQREQTVDHLLEIVRRDRTWNDDGARKQLVQLFEAWGPTDEATVAGRRRLSSILFA